jgi:hypothetical protein
MLSAALAALVVAGCAATPAPRATAASPAPDSRVVKSLTDSAARQVKRCYRSPRLSRDARQISTRLRVTYAPDGQLATLPVLLEQGGVTEANRAHARAMAEAAMLAVVRCSPLSLPREYYQAGWDEFDLTFSPRTFG